MMKKILSPFRFLEALRWGWILVVLFVLGAAPGTSGPLEVFDEAWRAVRDHFYDPSYSGLDWEAVRQRYRPVARRTPARAMHTLINQMLAELGASHTVLLPREVFRDHIRPEFTNRKVPLVGLELIRLEEGLFVRSLLEGGSAERAGVLRGDRLISIDGAPPRDSPHLLPGGSDPGIPGPPDFVLSAADTDRIRLGLVRSRGRQAIEIVVVPQSTNQIEAIRRSIRVVERGGFRVGVIHLRHLISPVVARIFEGALQGKFANVDGLVVDLRGRGGRPDVAARVLRSMRGYPGPMVAVIDGHTRSAKEVVAFRIRKEGIGILVGERTQGAVLGGAFHTLSDGSVLMIATMDVDSLTDGVRLEGEGVSPDVWIEDRIQYAAGEDPLVERGLEVLAARLAGAPLSPRPWY